MTPEHMFEWGAQGVGCLRIQKEGRQRSSQRLLMDGR